MKKIITLSVLAMLCLLVTNKSQAQTQVDLTLDYWGMDYGYTQSAAVANDTFDNYAWKLNKNYPNDSLFTLRFACVFFDTLINYDFTNNAFVSAYPLNANTTVRLDSFDLYYAHNRSNTASADTLYLKVFDITTTSVTGTGATAQLNFTTIWSDSIKVTGSTNMNSQGTSIGNGFYYLTRRPNLTLPAGHAYAIYVEFRGNKSNYLRILGGGRDGCSSQCGVEAAYAPDNSLYYLNLISQGTNYSGINPITYNCGSCENFEVQNFALPSYAHLTVAGGGATAPTVVTNAATAVTSNSATLNGSVNANGSSTTVTFEWGLTTSYGNTVNATPNTVTGSSATAVSYALGSLAPNTTYHFRAKGVNAGGTNYGVDQQFTTLASGSVCTPDPGVTSGLSPASANVPCVQQGVSWSQTYTFVIPSTVAGGAVTVTSVRFDSIVNLPAGLTAQFSLNPAVYAGGATGCMLVSGTTNAPCGQYWVKIYVTIVTNAITVQGELSDLATQYSIPGFSKNWLRVIGQGGTCPALNTSQTVAFAAGSCGTTSSITATASKTDVSCNGGNNGTATAVPSGGTTYTYLWSNGGTTATITGLTAGNYTVTVSDAGGGTATASVTVGQPANPLTASASATQTVCGQNSGSATVNATGGTPNYTIAWSNGGNTATASNLGAGNYTVTVTDSKGCSATASTAVTTPNGPSATATASAVNCFGGSTGSVDATITGGTGALVYAWSNGATTQDLANVPAGNYTLTVTDANSCSFSVAATVTQPGAALTVTGTATNATSGNNGSVNITAAGGTGSYLYSWSNAATTEDISGLGAGTYSVTVTDQNNCTATATFTVTSNVSINGIDMVTKFTAFPNPATTMLNVQLLLTESTDVKIELLDLTGKLVIAEDAGNVKQLNQALNTSAVANGTYVLHVFGSKVNIRQNVSIAK